MKIKLKHGYFLVVVIGLMLSGCSIYKTSESKLIPQYTPVAKGKMEYYKFGKGSPIVLIPGYATDVSSWSSSFLRTLANEHQLIVLNNRNIGGSRIYSSRYMSYDLANDVFQLMHNLHLKKPAVLGISMGGMIAQQVAALHPNHVGQLILINTAISGHQAVHPSPRIEKKIWSIPHNKLGFYVVAVDCFFPSRWKIRMAYKLVTDRFLPKNHSEVNLTKIIPPQQNLLMDWTNDDITAIKISKIPMPVLILNGCADSVIPPINSSILLQTIPHAELIHWKDGGHAMIYQYPKQIAQSINQFIMK